MCSAAMHKSVDDLHLQVSDMGVTVLSNKYKKNGQKNIDKVDTCIFSSIKLVASSVLTVKISLFCAFSPGGINWDTRDLYITS